MTRRSSGEVAWDHLVVASRVLAEDDPVRIDFLEALIERAWEEICAHAR